MENSTIEIKGKEYVVVNDSDHEVRLIPAEKFEAVDNLVFKYTGDPIDTIAVEEVVFGDGDACTVLVREDNDCHHAKLWKMDESAKLMAETLDAEDCFGDYIVLEDVDHPESVDDIVQECEDDYDF